MTRFTPQAVSGNGQQGIAGRLTDRVAVITGSANGIGRSMAHVFSQAGARVVIADIDRDGGLAVAEEIRQAGHQAIFLQTDIAQLDSVRGMIQGAVDQWGRLDILVNNAGVGLNRPFLQTTLEEWSVTLGVVLTGTFLCSQVAARVMVEQGAGAIVNVASISGQRGAQGRAAYGAAKAGVIQLTRVMAVELASLGVRVNAISPGPVDTYQSRSTHTPATRRSYVERIPLHRYGECDEVALAALFLASDDARFVHGHILNVDGGFYCAGLMFDPNEPASDGAAAAGPESAEPGAESSGNGAHAAAKGFGT